MGRYHQQTATASWAAVSGAYVAEGEVATIQNQGSGTDTISVRVVGDDIPSGTNKGFVLTSVLATVPTVPTKFSGPGSIYIKQGTGTSTLCVIDISPAGA